MNTDDAGTGSLRQAILDANATPNLATPDAIDFNIPATGPQKIQPLTPLPPINEPLIIDGYSQPGSQVNADPLGDSNAVLLIEVDGSLTTNSNGLTISDRGSGSSIRGLVINNFDLAGLFLDFSNDNIVAGNFIGTDPLGMTLAPNGVGLLIDGGSRNFVGLTSPDGRNVIAGNDASGVVVHALVGSNPAEHNSILGNSIFANAQLGIDLGDDGPTANDADDGDAGANLLQNFPVLSNATSDAMSTTLDVALQSQPSATFRLEFFANDAQGTTIAVQGQRFLGAIDVVTNAAGTANTSVVLAGPVPVGQFITATATDNNTADTSEFSAAVVQATNHAPVLAATGTQTLTGTDEDTISAGDLVSAVVGATISDVDNGAVEGIAITATDGNGTWEFSTNGGTNFSPIGTVSTTQAFLLRDTDLVRYVPDQLNGETATITYLAWDQTGTTSGQQGTKVDVSMAGLATPFSLNTDTASLLVGEVNDAPVLAAIGDQGVDEEATLNFTAMATDLDLPVQNLTFSLDTAAITAGMNIDANTGEFSFTPTESQGGMVFNATITVTDGGSNPATLTDFETISITINEVNGAPLLGTIGDQNVNEEETLNFTALATDQDTPAQKLTFSLDTAAITAGMSIDADTGEFSFTPAESQGGMVFNATLTVTDDGSNPATLTAFETISITVNEVNAAPVLGTIGDQNVNEEATLNFTALATDLDLPAQDLTFSLDTAAIAAGMSIDADTGAFSFTPPESQGGMVFNATITVTDDGSNPATLTAFETISITVDEVNVAPVLTAVGNRTVDEQTPLTFTALATDQDLPAQNLTFSLDAAAITTGMSIDSNTGDFSFTPTESQGGMVFDATITVTDDGTNAASLTDFETITITVNEVNVAPELAVIPDVIVVEGNTLSFTATATDQDLPAQSLTFSLDTAAIAAGMSIDANTGAFRFTPTNSQAGNYDVTVTVTESNNPASLFDSKSFTVVVRDNNSRPVAMRDTASTTENTPVTTDVLANDFDIDGDLLSLVDVNLDATTGLTVSPATAGSVSLDNGQVFFDPGTAFDELAAGDIATVAVDYVVSDDAEAATLSTLVITVNGINDAPVLDPSASMTLVPIGEDDVAGPGTRVSGILASAGASPISDLDNGAVEGVALVAASGSNSDGWEFSIDGGMSFQPVGDVSSDSALLLRSNDSLRYVPDPSGESSGMPTVDFRAWDQTGATAGQQGLKVDSSITGEATPFSNSIGGATLGIGRTTAVLVDDGGTTLFINDVAPGGKDDLLSVTFDPQTRSLVVGDSAHIIADLTGTPTTSNVVQVSLAGMSGIVIDLGDGDDTLDLDLSGLGLDSLDMPLTIFGGDGLKDRLVISGAAPVGTGALTVAGNDMEEILVNGTISTSSAAVTLVARQNLEVNANISAGGTVSLTATEHDIFGNCSRIDAGTEDVSLVSGTGIGAVQVSTAGNVTMDSGSGGIVGCAGEISVNAASLTLVSAASVGLAALVAGQAEVIERFQTSIDAISGSVGGLGIFLLNDKPLTGGVETVDATPLGVVDIVSASNGASPEGEGSPRQNPNNRLDVNDDNLVSPIDGLAVINYLNAVGAAGLSEGSSSEQVKPYVDVNGDHTVSPVDVLEIINYLNGGPRWRPEGESSWPSLIATVATEPASQPLEAHFVALPLAMFGHVDVQRAARATTRQESSEIGKPIAAQHSPARAANVRSQNRPQLRRVLRRDNASDELEWVLSRIAADVGAVWSDGHGVEGS